MQTQKKRHWLLPVLCILTFIGSGFGILVSVLSLIDMDLLRFTINIPTYTSVITNIADSHYSYSIVSTILYFVSIIGAIYMWNLRKKGFFIYSLAQLALPTMSFFYFPYPLAHTFSILIPNYIFAIAFIAMYSLHLKSMNTVKTHQKNKSQEFSENMN